MYDQGFQRFHMGYASAIAYVIFGCVFGLTVLNFRDSDGMALELFHRPRDA